MSHAVRQPKPILTPADFYVAADAPRLRLGIRPILLVVLIGSLCAAFLVTLAVGSVDIPLEQIVLILLGEPAERQSWANIILKVRLPKAMTAMLAGAALGVSGLMMQTFFRNSLAGPFVLGISSGASLGVALVVLSSGTAGGVMLAGLGLRGDWLLAGAAAVGAAATMIVVLMVADRVTSRMTLLILGLMIGYLVTALVSLLLYFAIPESIQAYVSWTFGSFSQVTWSQMPILASSIGLGLAGSMGLIKSLNALLLGEAYARSLGMNVRLVRIALIGSTALLAGSVTAFCGPIAFLGIAVPHLCRSLFQTSDHRILVPATMLVGAILALVAALVAQAPGHNIVLPLNAVTALIGAPVVVMVILRGAQRSPGFSE